MRNIAWILDSRRNMLVEFVCSLKSARGSSPGIPDFSLLKHQTDVLVRVQNYVIWNFPIGGDMSRTDTN